VVDPDLLHKAHDVIFDDPRLDVVVLTAALPQSQDGLSPQHDNALRRIADRMKTAHAQVMLASHLMSDHSAFARTYRAGLGLPMMLPGVEKGPAGPGPGHLVVGESCGPLVNQVRLPSHRPLPAPTAAGTGSVAWSELRAREHIVAAGVPVVPGELAVSADAAVAAAGQLGYPVVLKAVSARPAAQDQHRRRSRSTWPTRDAVRDAFRRVTEAASAHVPDLEGVLVTAMRRGGVELIVGVVSDPLWGPVLAVGLGGIWVEVLRDSAQRLLPASRAEGPGHAR